jgi:hypothetical protein
MFFSKLKATKSTWFLRSAAAIRTFSTISADIVEPCISFQILPKIPNLQIYQKIDAKLRKRRVQLRRQIVGAASQANQELHEYQGAHLWSYYG